MWADEEKGSSPTMDLYSHLPGTRRRRIARQWALLVAAGYALLYLSLVAFNLSLHGQSITGYLADPPADPLKRLVWGLFLASLVVILAETARRIGRQV
jgi:hypothetical protein